MRPLIIIVNNFKETIGTYGSESILRYSYAGTMGLFKVLQQIIFQAVLVLQTKIEVFALPKQRVAPFMVKH